jgi:hypothetical protein
MVAFDKGIVDIDLKRPKGPSRLSKDIPRLDEFDQVPFVYSGHSIPLGHPRILSLVSLSLSRGCQPAKLVSWVSSSADQVDPF